MTKQTKHILWAIGIALAAWSLYAMYKAWTLGESIITAPFRYLGLAGSAIASGAATVAGNAQAAASIPALATQSQQLDQTIIANQTTDYAPGGRIYNQIASSQGVDAANAAWTSVQQHQTSMQSQTSTYSLFSPSTWFN